MCLVAGWLKLWCHSNCMYVLVNRFSILHTLLVEKNFFCYHSYTISYCTNARQNFQLNRNNSINIIIHIYFLHQLSLVWGSKFLRLDQSLKWSDVSRVWFHCMELLNHLLFHSPVTNMESSEEFCLVTKFYCSILQFNTHINLKM